MFAITVPNDATGKHHLSKVYFCQCTKSSTENAILTRYVCCHVPNASAGETTIFRNVCCQYTKRFSRMGHLNTICLLSRILNTSARKAIFTNASAEKAILTTFVCCHCIKHFNRKGHLIKVCLLSVYQTLRWERSRYDVKTWSSSLI